MRLYFYSPGISVLADADINNIKFKFTCYSDQDTDYNALHSGLMYKDFTVNPKYNWYEYNYNGENYVVLAAATKQLLNSGFAEERDYIHYFNVTGPPYETIEFKFEDTSFDSNIYKGIILDSCGASMKVGENDPQILDVYITGSASDCINSKINQKRVMVSDNGSFPNSQSMSEYLSSGLSGAGNFIVTVFSKGFCLLGDLAQRTIDFAGITDNYSLELLKNSLDIKRSRDEIEKDEELNKQIQIIEYRSDEEDSNFKGMKQILVKNIAQDENGDKKQFFLANTPIPILPMDWYSLSINKSTLTDINFLDASHKNPNAIWKIVRKIVSVSNHIVLYLSAVLLFTMLIIRGIMLVSGSIRNNPEYIARARQVMDRWVEAVIMMIGIFFIMALITSIYQYIVDLIVGKNPSSYLLRLNVEGLYSFNTNSIGYVRYMTLTTNRLASLGYSVVYFLLAVVDVLWFVAMIFRMLVIGALTAIAPLTAVVHIAGLEGRNGFHFTNYFHFENWIRVYLRLVWAPLILIILQKILVII